jgi:methionyl-tRNA formyltransferase
MRVVMMGTGTFAEPTLEALLRSRPEHEVVGLVTQPDRAVGHERGSTRQTGKGMKAIALEHQVPVYQPEGVNTPEGVATLRGWRPDLLVVAAYGQILAKEVLEAAPHGGINVHASLLPKYRGAAPVAWAIYHGETKTGVTIIRMTTGLDAGDMLAQESLDIGTDETAGELEARLAPLGARLALEAVRQVAAGTAQGVKQDKSQVTKAPKLKKEDGLIDWNRTAEQVCNQVRAMQPWPTAYTYWHRQGKAPVRLIVNRAVPGTTRVLGDALSSGTVITDSDTVPSHLLVHTGQAGCVEIVELQPAGKRRMTAVEFLRGHLPQPGDFLGTEAP